jgi:hypothetical protein
MTDSESPTGRFRIAISPWEARMSLWIETPSLLDKTTGETLLSFKDGNWSLDAARWLSDSVVELTLRKYPGNHLPVQVVAMVDCAKREAKIGEMELRSLAEVEATLERMLTWRSAEAPPKKPTAGGFGALLRRFFLGR